MKRKIFVAVGIVGSILILPGCAPKQQMAASPPPEAGVVTIQAGPLPITTELPGRIDPVRTAQVRARVAGILLKRVFELGIAVGFERKPVKRRVYSPAVGCAEPKLDRQSSFADVRMLLEREAFVELHL